MGGSTLRICRKQQSLPTLYCLAQGVIILVVLLSVSGMAVQERHKFTVRGRAVDESGQPVARARIVLDAGLPPAETWEDFSGFVESDASGNFRYDDEAKPERAVTRILYVTGPVPADTCTPILPPFNRIKQLTEKRFAGRIITISKNATGVDVGDMPVQVRYGVVHIRLQDRTGNPLLTTADRWRVVWLRVRDDQGEVVSERSVAITEVEKRVQLKESSVAVSLPEGMWFIEASLFEDKGPWLVSGLLNVKSSGDPVQTVLRR